ncbi:MAG: glycerol kinase GlpK [Rhodothermaceae bacterium]|nr:glycerol kinase GlpK [Rhodothermaceae bacterium]
MNYILALDQGTTSSRAILFDKQGTIHGVAQQEFEQIFPKPGWVEHNAEEIWTTQLDVAREVLKNTGTNPSQVSAVGITNQRETTLLWDRSTGKPIGNAIVWQDRRTAGFCDKLKANGHEELFRSKTGLVIDAYFSGTKIKWLLDNIEGARAAAEAGNLAFGTMDSWLVWNLTNGKKHITDVSNASRTLIYNIHSCEWDQELLDLLDIPASVLPDVRSSSEVYGHADANLLGAPIPVAGIAGDQQAALFGQMCTQAGMVKNTYGTGCFMLMNTGEKAVASNNNLLTTIAWKIGDTTHYALEGSIFIAGAVVQWLRDGLQIIDSAPEIEALANSVEDNGGVYIVPAFTGLGAPHWDQYARGTITGITRGSTKAHFARAALEGIAYQVADVLDAMKKDAGIDLAQMRADGGASANNLLMQFQSDMLGVPVLRPKTLETTALGAAYLAGLAVGYWGSLEEISQQWQLDQEYTPSMPADQVAHLKSGWNKALDRAARWAEDE